MRPRFLALLVLVPAVGLVLLPAPQSAHGCAVAPHRGEYVEIASETAAIFWDPKTKTEHFIRAASFTTSSADFGFLVPTPTLPEFGEVPQSLFAQFSAQTAPRYEYRTQVVEIDPPGGCGMLPEAMVGERSNAAPAGAARDGVQVLDRGRVGGFERVSLKADDPTELLKWLSKNGYDARPELKAWLQWYTDNNWVVTAFKIASDPEGGPRTVATHSSPPIARTAAQSAIRMSFKSELPFYPYREPEDQRQHAESSGRPRLLRVFFMSDGRFDGTIGDKRRWPGQTVWSKELTAPQFEPLASAAGVKLPADGKWTLTEFEDKSSPRPGMDEVYFARSEDQSAVERPPVVIWDTKYKYRERSWAGAVVAAAVAVPVLALIAGLILWRLLRRRNVG